MTKKIETPARKAAQEAIEKVFGCIDKNQSFILEAGAGSGKTYSLINTLEYLIEKRGAQYRKQHKQVACITFTNVAMEEINSRTDNHPVICTDTIHGFCWSLIRVFQTELKKELPALGNWAEKLEESEVQDLTTREIIYENGYKRILDTSVSIHHDDVISLTVKLMENDKFRSLMVSKYPVLLIDEYQDTNADFAEALENHFIDGEEGLLIGLFGDHWQKIYGNGCGKIENESLEEIEKNSNFRSAPQIVNVLNHIRPELKQEVEFPDIEGSVNVYHTNGFGGQRREGTHWAGDLEPADAHSFLESLKVQLEQNSGWDMSPEKTKVLMLTHNVLAEEQGYKALANVFRYNESFIKKEDKHILFFADVLEPVIEAYEGKKYGKMFSVLGGKLPLITSHSGKQKWSDTMSELIELRESKTIGEVLDFLYNNELFSLPSALVNLASQLQKHEEEDESEEEKEELSYQVKCLKAMREVSYSEVIALVKYINGHTPFRTKHSVKGEQYENVLVVFGRGWNQYNFGQMLEWENSGIPADKESAYERSRNLFYVTCSRPTTNLALLFTQELSEDALTTLNTWFAGNVTEM